MTTINIYNKREIEQFIKEKVDKELTIIYRELQKLRVRIIDLEQLIKRRGF